jgi:hypothetical protein
MNLARYALACLAAVAASPAAAMVEQIPTIDPAATSCAAYTRQLRQGSIGRFVFAVNLLPVTAGSPNVGNPGEHNLYGDMVEYVVVPVDPASYAAIVKRKLPAWLFLSFDADPAASGTLRRSIAYAAPKGCQAGEAQYIAITDAPRNIKQQLLRALIDVHNGGKGNPMAIPWDDYTRIDNLFPASLDAELQNILQSFQGP